ncbi:ribosomal 40S subunit protein S1B [Rhizophlyctis rosea]|uniref:Ribosomal 40S subunit protein S1B n=1 Tax=Rhizophlyctis rosea TaxID=64517 RepID=A0AAD5S7H5_9FUNG|nr:ribosomal 40S subunit protein S1B [Rhizophlyctis rosea]
MADNNNNQEDFCRKIKLQVQEIEGKNCITNLYDMDFTSDKLRSLVKSWIEAFVDAKSTGGYLLRLFTIAFTQRRKNQLHKSTLPTNAQIGAIRKKMFDIMNREAATCDLKELEIEKACQAVYLYVAVRKRKIVETLKFDLGKLLELHGGHGEDKESKALHWFSDLHPQTFFANLKHVGQYVCWKDLLLLLDHLKKTKQEYAEAEKELQEFTEKLTPAGKDPKKLISLRFSDITKIDKYDNRKHQEIVRNEKWRVPQMKGTSAEEIAKLKEAHRKGFKVTLKDKRLQISVSRKIKLEEVQKATRKKLDNDPVFKAMYGT